MISNYFRVFLLFGIVLYFAFFIVLVRKKHISVRYALLWFAEGVFFFLITMFPELGGWLAKLMGITLPSNAVFLIILFSIILMQMTFTSIISRMNEKIKILVQEQAILEKKIRELEKDKKD